MLSLSMEGVVAGIFIAPDSGQPMQPLECVEAVNDCGLRGDRYLRRTGYWSGVDECQVTLIELEILHRIAEESGLVLSAGEHRRNIVTQGIRLSQLLGKRFGIGGAVLEYQRPRPPCAHIGAVAPAGTARALFGQRGGIGARVVQSGLIRVQDWIGVVPS